MAKAAEASVEEHKVKDMALAFSCGRCDARVAKSFSKQAYEQGVVIITCPGCGGRHLIADNLGWFGDKASNIETILKERGDEVTRLQADGDLDIDTLVDTLFDTPAQVPPLAPVHSARTC